ncbi:MAG: PDZ domain-containing protein [Longimicrobiales bacterium]
MKSICLTIIGASCMIGSASLLSAQTPAPQARGRIAATAACENGAPVANLGFAFAAVADAGGAVRYNVYGASRAAVSYRDEPRIGQIDPKGPAAGRLQNGDRIARVNGLSIVTPEGTTALSSAQPGHSIILTVRRDDKLIPVTVTPVSTYCPSSREAMPSRAVVGSPPQKWTQNPPTAVTMDRRPFLEATRASGAYPGWLGLGFDCSNCGMRQTPTGRAWYFDEAPTIYNVDNGSPAFKAGLRRGDVLLRVDGVDVKSTTAGARLGQARPGESLRFTYRRGDRTAETTVRVSENPVVTRDVVARVSGELLRSTQELRAAQNDVAVKDLLTRTERSSVVQEANIEALRKALVSGSANSVEARSALLKLSAQQDANVREQKRMLREILRLAQAETAHMGVVEREIESGAAVRPLSVAGYNMVVDSVNGRISGRMSQQRYSGSVGTANVEVLGPGSVSVQRDGDDLIINTGDAIIRVTTRKVR